MNARDLSFKIGETWSRSEEKSVHARRKRRETRRLTLAEFSEDILERMVAHDLVDGIQPVREMSRSASSGWREESVRGETDRSFIAWGFRRGMQSHIRKSRFPNGVTHR